jgi:hypothetical protein
MEQINVDNSPRRMLISMAKGQHSGYWVEVLHHAEDGAAAYILHTPTEAQNGRTWRDKPALPCTWDALRMLAAKHMGDDNAADALPKYDEKRTYTGDVQDTRTMAALLKWAKI